MELKPNEGHLVNIFMYMCTCIGKARLSISIDREDESSLPAQSPMVHDGIHITDDIPSPDASLTLELPSLTL